jgi:hypothetical protein
MAQGVFDDACRLALAGFSELERDQLTELLMRVNRNLKRAGGAYGGGEMIADLDRW